MRVNTKNENISVQTIVTNKMAMDSKSKLEQTRSMINHNVSPEDKEHYTVTVIKRDGTPVTFTTDDMYYVRTRVEELIRDWKAYLGKIGEVEVGHHSREMTEAYRQMTYGAEPMEIYVATSYRNDPLNNSVERSTVSAFLTNCGEFDSWRVLPDHV